MTALEQSAAVPAVNIDDLFTKRGLHQVRSERRAIGVVENLYVGSRLVLASALGPGNNGPFFGYPSLGETSVTQAIPFDAVTGNKNGIRVELQYADFERQVVVRDAGFSRGVAGVGVTVLLEYPLWDHRDVVHIRGGRIDNGQFDRATILDKIGRFSLPD